MDESTRKKIGRFVDQRDAQLWLLALVVMFLLTMALLFVDVVNMKEPWWVSPELKLALNTRTMRVALVLSILLICAYFRDSARRLRRENHELIDDLEERGRLLEKKNCEITRLKDLSDQLIGVTDLHLALDLVLDMAVQVIGADTASIMLKSKGEDDLHIAASRGIPKKVINSTRVKIGESIAGLVAQNGQAVLLNSDELVGEMAKRTLRKHAIVSSVIVPIHINEDVRGVISIAKRRGSDCFTEEDLGVLSTLASQTSLVIQKTELLDNLRDQIEKLAFTVEELRQAQVTLVEAEKLASIGRLAGGVSHEINNPLQVILGRVELMLQSETDPAKLRQLQSVMEHTTRISEIVTNLLSFSRRSSGAPFKQVEIGAVLDRTLSLLEPQLTSDGVLIESEIDDRDMPVLANASDLQQVFTNIILNAHQAMHGRPESKITVRIRNEAGSAAVEIADNGPGIPQESLAHLFEPFFTTKSEGEGTGLGLSIAYGIVEAHGGRISARNNSEGGACFSITLPIDRALGRAA
ncbi:MAG: ATP-binding protein [Armatimonadota bacterium]